MSDTTTIEERIVQKIAPGAGRELAVSESAGGLSFANADQAMTFAKLMAVAGVAVPKHLRGNPGACLAIVVQAIEWRVSPFSLANKSYSVNDRLAYESQLIQAIVLQRAPIRGRFGIAYTGKGDERVCRVSAVLKDTGETVDYESPPLSAITPRNSPLWKSDPDQQLFYYSARALCRRHFPDVLLGVYAREELEGAPAIGPEHARDVTPPASLAEQLDTLAGGTAAGDVAPPDEEVPEEVPPSPEPEPEALTPYEYGRWAFHHGFKRRQVPTDYKGHAFQDQWLDGYDQAKEESRAQEGAA